jgi:hypothetical protein
MTKPTAPTIQTHIHRVSRSGHNVRLMSASEEEEQEKDLVPAELWGPVRILPVHERLDHDRQPNAEVVNDRVKLLFHRLIARRLGQDPSLVVLARQELAKTRESREERTYMAEWDELLSRDIDTLRREIIRRDERMTRLRISSPLGCLIDVSDPDLRRRIWRSARQALAKRQPR